MALSSRETEYSALVKVAAEESDSSPSSETQGSRHRCSVCRLINGEINCKPDWGRNGEEHPHEVALDSGDGSRRQNNVDEDPWMPQSSGRSE